MRPLGGKEEVVHPSQDELLQFLSGRETTERASLVYAHADACAACAERLAALRRLRDDFDGAWSDFLDEARARSAAQAAPVASLIARGVMDRAQRMVSLAAEGLRPVADAIAAIWAAPSPIPHGIGAPGEGAATATRTLDVFVAGARAGTIVCDARRGTVSVVLDDAALGGQVATAILTTGGAAQVRLRARLEPVEAASYRLAEFEAVADGGFELAIELRPSA
jgi:hypothetical protein